MSREHGTRVSSRSISRCSSSIGAWRQRLQNRSRRDRWRRNCPPTPGAAAERDFARVLRRVAVRRERLAFRFRRIDGQPCDTPLQRSFGLPAEFARRHVSGTANRFFPRAVDSNAARSRRPPGPRHPGVSAIAHRVPVQSTNRSAAITWPSERRSAEIAPSRHSTSAISAVTTSTRSAWAAAANGAR